jgi:outer membrane protein
MSAIKTLNSFLFISIFICSIPQAVLCQNGQQLSLDEVIRLAKTQSLSAKQAETAKQTRHWKYQVYLSNYKPQLILDGLFPSYNHSFEEVVQPDGNILFQPVNYNNSSVSLNLQQNIAATGTKLFFVSQLQRFDDFENDRKFYNGRLFAFGIEQPLFQTNHLKWDKKIEPLLYEESQKEYHEELELISLKACEYYFDALMAQENLLNAKTSRDNTQSILDVVLLKYEMGKVSENEVLQLQLELLKSKKQLAKAKRDLKISWQNLKSFIGKSNLEEEHHLIVPMPESDIVLQEDKLMAEAIKNRADPVSYRRRLLQAEKEIVEARSKSGLNFFLTANLGYSNSGITVNEIVKDYQSYKSVALKFSVPILDWGRSEAGIKMAKENYQLEKQTAEQAYQDFQNEIYTQITLFDMLSEQMTLSFQADSIASEKYKIAKARYMLGKLSVTDLGIAIAERDQAQQDLILVLRDYWNAYYKLKYLTLFDLVPKQ